MLAAPTGTLPSRAHGKLVAIPTFSRSVAEKQRKAERDRERELAANNRKVASRRRQHELGAQAANRRFDSVRPRALAANRTSPRIADVASHARLSLARPVAGEALPTNPFPIMLQRRTRGDSACAK
jgi:hypothetical protein